MVATKHKICAATCPECAQLSKALAETERRLRKERDLRREAEARLAEIRAES